MRWILPLATVPAWASIAATWAWDPALWPWVLPAGGLLLGTVGAGVARPSLGLFHPALSHGPSGSGRISLTFDDGPDPEHTPQVLDALERWGARATFFMVGQRVEAHPRLAREVLERGHEVAHHSHTHGLWISFPGQRRLAEDFERASRAIAGATGRRPRLFRSPVGLMNPRIAREVARRDMVVVAWTVRPRDGVVSDPGVVARRVREGLADGGIVLLHDGRSPHLRAHVPPAARALPAILEHVAARGWRAVTVSELTGEEPYAG